MKEPFQSIEDYISSFPSETGKILRKVYTTIKRVAPDAAESISYGMPAFSTNGRPLVYFAGFKNHIGFYATPTGHAEFEQELSEYKRGKGSVQFPIDKPIPFDLIGRIVEFRVKENLFKSKR
ncbi:MAG: DUF1801 domain-containing protein [Bacteroidales bacterium]|jgi:uncharacterized protein YdhG (YjbR/CyaY superfamily)|nr:DUF1801 domain-containing protein [Bacteroidales bacterium]